MCAHTHTPSINASWPDRGKADKSLPWKRSNHTENSNQMIFVSPWNLPENCYGYEGRFERDGKWQGHPKCFREEETRHHHHQKSSWKLWWPRAQTFQAGGEHQKPLAKTQRNNIYQLSLDSAALISVMSAKKSLLTGARWCNLPLAIRLQNNLIIIWFGSGPGLLPEIPARAPKVIPLNCSGKSPLSGKSLLLPGRAGAALTRPQNNSVEFYLGQRPGDSCRIFPERAPQTNS